MRIRQAGQVALFHQGGGKTWFGEYHHAGGRLQQMRTGPAANDQEEGVLDLAVQPDDAGQAAEDFALAALAQDRRVAAAAGQGQTHAARTSSRAARSFRMNWVALMT